MSLSPVPAPLPGVLSPARTSSPAAAVCGAAHRSAAVDGRYAGSAPFSHASPRGPAVGGVFGGRPADRWPLPAPAGAGLAPRGYTGDSIFAPSRAGRSSPSVASRLSPTKRVPPTGLRPQTPPPPVAAPSIGSLGAGLGARSPASTGFRHSTLSSAFPTAGVPTTRPAPRPSPASGIGGYGTSATSSSTAQSYAAALERLQRLTRAAQPVASSPFLGSTAPTFAAELASRRAATLGAARTPPKSPIPPVSVSPPRTDGVRAQPRSSSRAGAPPFSDLPAASGPARQAAAAAPLVSPAHGPGHAELQSELDAAKATIDEMKQKMAALEWRCSGAERALRTKEAELEVAQEQRDQAERLAEQLHEQLEEGPPVSPRSADDWHGPSRVELVDVCTETPGGLLCSFEWDEPPDEEQVDDEEEPDGDDQQQGPWPPGMPGFMHHHHHHHHHNGDFDPL